MQTLTTFSIKNDVFPVLHFFRFFGLFGEQNRNFGEKMFVKNDVFRILPIFYYFCIGNSPGGSGWKALVFPVPVFPGNMLAVTPVTWFRLNRQTVQNKFSKLSFNFFLLSKIVVVNRRRNPRLIRRTHPKNSSEYQLVQKTAKTAQTAKTAPKI